MSDLIKRIDALVAIRNLYPAKPKIDFMDTISNWRQKNRQYMECERAIEELPSAEPEPKEFEWCTGCKEYDQEAHCCHRWTKVIRNTVEEIKNSQPERKKGKWIRLKPQSGGYWQCSACGFPSEAFAAKQLYKYCPNCGAKMEGETDE